MKKAIIIGASSGIGRALASVLAKHGYELGITARRLEKLHELKQTMTSPVYCSAMDVSQPNQAVVTFQALVQTMGGADLVIISAGTGYLNTELDYDKEQQTIAVNVSGFVAIADAAFNYFVQTGWPGHIVGISSIAAWRGGYEAPAYNASKAFVSNYLQGLRALAKKKHYQITVTDIQPGFVDTPMAKSTQKFWVAPAAIAARQIFLAIERKKKRAYVTRRWRLIAWLFKLLPA
ncbi:MAG: SDR family NAD(P)-dependent oxidoreductase [Candidatus Kerfeldbacteria bacterium]|nr:SDR family NAD(P)-dependent oxidoreductase [Candidatus Kerfeldbacteria bacterium]